VLEGYRRWTAGFETGSIIPVGNDLGPLFGSAWDLRKQSAQWASCRSFIRVLRHCASCQLRAFPFDSHHVCREECLTLGLISGIQNQDALAARYLP
jgi:hypothetical protein